MSSKTVVILHDKISVNAREDELDDLIQTEAVAGALKRLDFETVCLPFCMQQMAELNARLKSLNPLFVVNLVETVDGKSSLSFAAGELLESLGIKYTGNCAQALSATTDKLTAKRLLRSFGIATPEWVEASGEGIYLEGERYLIKPVSEEGSVGIHDLSVSSFKSREALVEKMRLEAASTGRECFAERYIDGRELNVSMLGSEEEPVILPVSEILFIGYEEKGLPRIVNYDAKWKADSYVYKNSIRSFLTGGKDADLVREICAMAKMCWSLFRLRGYARIDFRVDKPGIPWIIDINANPCISPDSGFIAAAEKAGLDYDGVIKRIIREAGIGFDTWKGVAETG